MAYAPQQFGFVWGGWVQGTNKKYRKQEGRMEGYSKKKITC
jgi:hypothetical protein